MRRHVAEHHDSRETHVAMRLAHVIDDGSNAARVYDQLRQLLVHKYSVSQWNKTVSDVAIDTSFEVTQFVFEFLLTSGVCLAISLMSVATFLRTYSSLSLRQVRTAGKISASTTISDKSTECFEI